MKKNHFTPEECLSFFNKLFPKGFAGSDVEEILVPSGWESSEYKVVFHPTAEQLYEEYKNLKQNISKLTDKQEQKKLEQEELNIEEFQTKHKDQPCEPQKELRELVGMCAWDIFSDNQEVISSDKRIVDLGSARGSADFIAGWINDRLQEQVYNYMDFYLGTKWICHRADLSPVYGMIFSRLNKLEADWIYHFPRLYLLSTKQSEEAEDDPVNYNPSEAFLNKIKGQDKKQKQKELQEYIERMNREAIEEAAQDDPPKIVKAYAKVYGHFPKGWPPVY